MLPTINGKSFLECNEEDLKVLIENSDYRENEYLDYKEYFSFLLYDKKDPKRAKYITEFKNDICSFANANGGYLIYGISDDKGMAKEIIGIDIQNDDTDRFELDRKNNLNQISPKIPSIKFGFIKLKNGKFVVIIYVNRDGFAPYIHLEDGKNYKAYKRVGNGKVTMSYTELKNMFAQSQSLEKGIQQFRKERIDFFRSQEDTPEFRYSKFLLLHIIPDTFMDTSYNNKLFVVSQKKDIKFSDIFYYLSCQYIYSPTVEGLKFPKYMNSGEGLLYNNGIAEAFCPYYDRLTLSSPSDLNQIFATTATWNMIENIVNAYIEKMKDIISAERVFVAISLIGLKNVKINNDDGFRQIVIDRDELLLNPIEIDNIKDEETVIRALKMQKIDYSLALGISNSSTLNTLIKEIYG